MAKVPPPIGKGEPPAPGNTMGNLDMPTTKELVPLNFKVPVAFRREFKIFAAQHGMDMIKVMQEAFALFKREKMK